MRQPPAERTALLLFAATLLSSPLTANSIAWGGGLESPFLYNALTRLGMAAAFLPPLIILARRTPPGTVSTLVRHPGFWATAVLWLTVNGMDSALFALASAHVDISTAFVIMQTHPLVMILLAKRLDRRTRRLQLHTPTLAVAAAGCTAGTLLLTAAETGGLHQLFALPPDAWPRIPAGYALAAAAMLAVSMTALSIKWAETAAAATGHHRDRETACLALAMTMTTGSLTAAAASAALGTALHETLQPEQALWGFIVTGVLVQAPSSLTWRSALLLSDHVQLNALLYLSPPASLALQWATGVASVASPHLAWAGSSLIIISNSLLAKRRTSRPTTTPRNQT